MAYDVIVEPGRSDPRFFNVRIPGINAEDRTTITKEVQMVPGVLAATFIRGSSTLTVVADSLDRRDEVQDAVIARLAEGGHINIPEA